MAIITRWRMPPESWWGYSSSRRLASAMRTRSSISPARSRAARHGTPRWRTTFSAICVPTVSTGLRLVIGSWKIIEMRWPRRRFIASSLSAVSSSPSKRIEPEAMRPVSLGIRRRMDSAVTDLPQPDSPTMPSVSPRASSNDTPSTARTTPSSVSNWVCRSRTSRIAFTAAVTSSRQPRVEPVAQPVAQKVHRQHGDGEERAGNQDGPGRDLEEGAALGDDVAPARHFRRHAGAQEAQARLDQHGRGADIGRLHDQRRQRVGQHVAQQQLGVPGAAGDGAFDVGLGADGEHDGAHHAHDPRHLGNDDGHDHDAEAGPRQGDERDGEQDRGDRHQAVHDPHDQAVDPAEVAAGQAKGEAEQAREGGDREAHDQRHARAVDGAREDVAAELVGAEPPALRRRPQPVDRRDLERIAGGDDRRQDRHDDQRRQQQAAEGDRRIAPDGGHQREAARRGEVVGDGWPCQ